MHVESLVPRRVRKKYVHWEESCPELAIMTCEAKGCVWNPIPLQGLDTWIKAASKQFHSLGIWSLNSFLRVVSYTSLEEVSRVCCFFLKCSQWWKKVVMVQVSTILCNLMVRICAEYFLFYKMHKASWEQVPEAQLPHPLRNWLSLLLAYFPYDIMNLEFLLHSGPASAVGCSSTDTIQKSGW